MTDTLTILDKLIGFESVTRQSNLALAGYAEEHLRACGFTVSRLPSPCGEKLGLYAEIGPPGEGVLLSAHTDVVPAAGQNWTRPPFRLTEENGRYYGRGTTDMKGYVAAMLSLAERVSAAGLREPLKLVLSYDEEIGCVGIQEMRDRLAPMIGRPRACFVGEPTQMQVATGHKGKAALRARCFGEGGHSALAPNFVNALHLAADFVTGLRELQSRYAEQGGRDGAYSIPYTSFHAGIMTGGTALNIVPDQAEITFEYRHLTVDHPRQIRGELDALAARISEKYRPRCATARVEIEQYNAYPGLELADDEGVTRYACKLAQNPETTKVAFGTEAGVLSELGVPTVVCGPGSMQGQGHKPDEYIEACELAACDAMMDRLLADLSR